MYHPPHWRRHPPTWPAGLHQKRRFLVWRFAVTFAAVFLVFLAGLAFVFALAGRAFGQSLPHSEILLLAACIVPVGFMLLMALLGGWAFRRIGTPLVDVMAAADAVAEGDLSVRVREDIPGEFGRMARSFNRMTAELGRADQQRRNLTADVAHELRTPLQIIQGNLEGILDGVYEPAPAGGR